MSRNTLIATIVIIVLLAAVGILYFRRQIQQRVSPTVTTQTEERNTVLISPTPMVTPSISGQPVAPRKANEVDFDGLHFNPSTLTIRAGTTVNFVNMSNTPMWVASNPHPSHTDLPGFDEKGNGDSYRFTFTKVGTWGYHNHPNPTIGGTIVVTP